MLRLLALSTTALVALSFTPAHAACDADGFGGVVCTGDIATPLDDATDGLFVTVDPDATISTADDAVTLGGIGAELQNDGVVESTGDEAVVSSGDGFTLGNTGVIAGDDRGVQLGGDSAFVTNSGLITGARGDAIRGLDDDDDSVRSDEDAEFVTIVNEAAGLIESTEGRAIRVRGFGASIVNDGAIIATEDETIEGRDGFTLENNGLIENLGEFDAVQFGQGTLTNGIDGIISGGDDGIDIDSGLIENAGLITSTGAGAGVDVDAENEDGSAAGLLRIENFGTISGAIGVGYDGASTADAEIFNTGLIEGFDGVAIDFAPGQGVTTVEMADEGRLIGDLNFGAAGGLLSLTGIQTEGDLLGGGVVFNATEIFTDMDLLSLILIGDIFTASFQTAFGGEGFFRFAGLPTQVTFANAAFTDADLAQIAPVPLPAAGWLLLAGLGAVAALRRRA